MLRSARLGVDLVGCASRCAASVFGAGLRRCVAGFLSFAWLWVGVCV